MKGNDKMNKTELFKYIDSQRDNMVSTLSQLISYPSYQCEPYDGAPFGKAVRDCLTHALGVCRDFGFITKDFYGYAGTASFTDDEPELGILAHLDVVPEGTGWTSNPYTARISDGKLFGRGAIDDKGPAVAVMYAMKAIKDMGIPLKKNVRLILGTNEENGSADLEYYFTKENPPKYTFTPDGNYPVINIEKGMIRGYFKAEAKPTVSEYPDSSERTVAELHGGATINAVPESAYAVVTGIDESEVVKCAEELGLLDMFTVKSIGRCLRIDVKGVSAHASTPESGKNAVTALIAVLAKLKMDDDCHKKISSLAELFPYGETNGKSLGINLNDKESGELTCVLSVTDYEAGSFDLKCDIRFPASFKVEDVLPKLTESMNKAGFELYNNMASQAHCVSADSPFVQKLLSVYEEMTGEKGECIAIGGGTYVHEIEGGVAFGAEFIGEDNHMHSADEFIDIDKLVLNAKMFALAILRVCGE